MTAPLTRNQRNSKQRPGDQRTFIRIEAFLQLVSQVLGNMLLEVPKTFRIFETRQHGYVLGSASSFSPPKHESSVSDNLGAHVWWRSAIGESNSTHQQIFHENTQVFVRHLGATR